MGQIVEESPGALVIRLRAGGHIPGQNQTYAVFTGVQVFTM
jgi:hypothetical protein